MWLLDVNMPKKLTFLLKEFGIEAQDTVARGWNTLSNSRLVEEASQAGFLCLLTRDRIFGESASKALKNFPEFAVVLITLPQLPGPEFLQAFRNAWAKTPIFPVPGQITLWPRQ